MVTVVVMVKVMVKKSLSVFKFKIDGESVAQVRDRAAKHNIL